MSELLTMQAEISLVAIILFMLLADLILKTPNHKPLQTLACTLTVVQLALNIVPASGEAFGGMYHASQMASVVKHTDRRHAARIPAVRGMALTRRYPSQSRRILYAHAQHAAGYVFHGQRRQLHSVLRRPGTGQHPDGLSGGFRQIPPSQRGSRSQVHPELHVLFCPDALWYLHGIRYNRYHLLCRHHHSPDRNPAPGNGDGVLLCRTGLQAESCTFPHVDTRYLSGSSTNVSAYLSVISKGAAAFALMSILVKVFGQMVADWSLLLSIVIVVTITIANIFAILQEDLKRFMAYSSISQAGYIMLAVLGGNEQGMASLVYYIVVYIVANLAVFGVISTIEQHTGGKVDRSTYNGLYKTNPRLSFVMTLALFSLAGIPPFAGFFSKFFVFASAFHSGHWLVVFLALVNTIISLYYYLLIVKAMYITPNDAPVATFRTPALARTGLFICLIGVIVLGICSGVYELLNHVAGLGF